MSHIFRLLVRIARGERLEQATPMQLRWYCGASVFIPIFIAGFVYFGRSILHSGSGVQIWLYAIACLLIAGLVVALWFRFVPVRVSLIAAVIVWIAAFWIAWHIDLAQF
jgi:hypothetical protein